MRDLYCRYCRTVSKLQSPAYLELLAEFERWQDEMHRKIDGVEREVEHRRRVRAFVRAFDDLLGPEELPTAIIDALYEDARQRLPERLPILLRTRK
jgi:hypothetical protein